jgi:putative restriction endonuclease
LRTVLIETYFATVVHPLLRAQGDMHLQSFLYSQKLIEKARQQVKESPAPGEDYQALVRDQDFRRAVLRIYDHRCTASFAMRRTVVDAVHCGLRGPYCSLERQPR